MPLTGERRRFWPGASLAETDPTPIAIPPVSAKGDVWIFNGEMRIWTGEAWVPVMMAPPLDSMPCR